MNDIPKIEKIAGGREFLPDAIKALAIILVVWGHAIQYFHGYGYDYWSDPVFKAIYGFHMPIFAGISGYLFSRSIQHYKPCVLVFRKAKSLLLPCITWGIIIGCINLLYDIASGSIPSFRTMLATPVKEVLNNYWFLKAVFVGCISVLAIEKWVHGYWFAYLALCVSTLLWPREQTIAFVLPYFVLGYIYGKQNERIYIPWRMALGSSLVYIAALFVYTKECYIYTSGMNLLGAPHPLKQFGICLFRFAVGIVGCIGFIGILEMILPKIKRKDILNKFGASTGVVYIVTTPLFVYSTYIIKKIGGVFAWKYPLNLIYNAGLLIVSLVLIFLTIRLVDLVCRFKWIARLFFGKWEVLQ